MNPRTAAALIMLTAAQASASFQTSFNSVRSASMGQVSMANSQEAPAVFMNPSGLAGLGLGEVSFIYDKLYAGLPGVGNLGFGAISLGLPTRWGTIGLGLGDFMASGLKEERTIALGFAGNVAQGIQAGLTAKHLYHRYDIGGDPMAARDPVFANGTSRSALGLDLGVSAMIIGPLRAGLSVRNVNRPDVGLAGEDRLPREVQAGLVVDVGGMGLTMMGDMFFRDSGFGDPQANMMPFFGVEKMVTGHDVAVRLGGNPMEFTGGVGIKWGRLGFDYGFALNRELLGDNAGSHKIGMSYRFGGVLLGRNKSRSNFRASRPQTKKHKGISNGGEIDYLILDDKALFGR